MDAGQWKVGRQRGEQCAQSPGRGHRSEQTTGPCKNEALDRELLCQPPSSCAQREPHAHFAIASQHAHEQQVGDIGAGDQQNEQDRREQDSQQRPDPSDGVLVQGHHSRAISGIHDWIFRGCNGGDAGHLLLCTAETDARAQARNNVEIAATVLSPHQSEHVDPPVRKGEIRWHDADDLVVCAADRDSPADDARLSTKAALPETVTQDGEPRLGGTFVW